jgi:hypothetical protein
MDEHADAKRLDVDPIGGGLAVLRSGAGGHGALGIAKLSAA